MAGSGHLLFLLSGMLLCRTSMGRPPHPQQRLGLARSGRLNSTCWIDKWEDGQRAEMCAGAGGRGESSAYAVGLGPGVMGSTGQSFPPLVITEGGGGAYFSLISERGELPQAGSPALPIKNPVEPAPWLRQSRGPAWKFREPTRVSLRPGKWCSWGIHCTN